MEVVLTAWAGPLVLGCDVWKALGLQKDVSLGLWGGVKLIA